MNASDIMTKTVITGRPDTTIKKAAELMSRHRISALPVLDDKGSIIGIVSEGDLMRRVEGAKDNTRSWWLSLFSESETSARGFVQERGQHLKDIMSTQVSTVTPDTPVGEIARLLGKKHIKRVPVVKDGKLVGVVSSCQPVASTRRTAGRTRRFKCRRERKARHRPGCACASAGPEPGPSERRSCRQPCRCLGNCRFQRRGSCREGRSGSD